MSGHYKPDEPYLIGVPSTPLPRRTAPHARPFAPEYGASTLTGPGVVSLALGAHAYGIPAGARIATPDGERAVVLVLTADGILHMLTAAGAVRNLDAAAASALGDEWLGAPEARPPT